MTNDVAKAIEFLQKRLLRGKHNSYWTERIELALDDLVRNPQRRGNPHYLARNALANSGKVLRRRSEICRINLMDDLAPGNETASLPALKVFEEACCDLMSVAELLNDSLLLTNNDRELLKLAAVGYGASELAAFQESSPERVRVRLCRARARIKAALNAV